MEEVPSLECIRTPHLSQINYEEHTKLYFKTLISTADCTLRLFGAYKNNGQLTWPSVQLKI